MGSLGRRLEALEERRRAEAVGEVAAIFKQLTDEEIALSVAGGEAKRDGREPSDEEIAAGRRAEEMGAEELIAAAIGFTERLGEEEVGRRISAMAREVAPLLAFRGPGIHRHLKAIRTGKV